MSPWHDYDVGADDIDLLGAMELLGEDFDDDDLLGDIDPETAAMLGFGFGDVWRGIKKAGKGAYGVAKKVLPIAINPYAGALLHARAASKAKARAAVANRMLTAGAYGSPAPSMARTQYAARLAQGRFGAAAAGAKEWPLGFPAVVFTDTTPTTQIVRARPQRLFRGRRPFIIVTRSAGAAAIGVSISRLDVGADNQLVGADPLPAETFGPTAFGTNLVMTPASPGIDVTVAYTVTAAPGVGETVTVLTSIHGDSWGS